MNSLKLILAAGLAATAGVAIGVLTAPRNGRKTREKIISDLETTKNSLEVAAKDRLKEAKEILSEKIDMQQSKGRNSLNKLKEAVRL